MNAWTDFFLVFRLIMLVLRLVFRALCLLDPPTALLMHAYITCLYTYEVLFYVIVLVCSRLAS
jgi:hypothetical protein